MADWEGLLALAQTQVWGEFFDQPQRKIAVERARVRIPKIASRHGRVTDSRQFHRSVLEGLDVDFEWVQWVNYRNLVEVLLFTFGNDSVTGSDPFTHTYSTEVAPNSLPSFNLFLDQGIENITTHLSGCKVNELRLENQSSGILLATILGPGRGRNPNDNPPPPPLTLTAADCEQFGLIPFIFSGLSYRQGLNGVVRAVEQNIEALTIRLRNNLIKRVPSTDTTLVIEPVEGFVEVDGSFMMEMEDFTEFDAYTAHQQLDLQAIWTSGIYSLTITIGNAKITAHPIPEARGTSGRGVVRVEFTGLIDDTDTISAVLVTDQNVVTLGSSSSSSQSSSSSSSSSNSSSCSSCCSSSSSSSSSSSNSSSSSSSSSSSQSPSSSLSSSSSSSSNSSSSSRSSSSSSLSSSSSCSSKSTSSSASAGS